VRSFPPVEHARWLTGGVLRHGLPVPWEEIGALEAALARVLRDAGAYAAGSTAAGTQSAEAYVASFDPGPALRDFLLGWWVLMGGAPPERGAVADALSSIAAHGGLAGLVTCLAYGPVGGWSALAEAMAATDGVDVVLGVTVTAVEMRGEVTVAAEDGRRFTARAVVIAVPLNCLPAIRFIPELPEPAREGAGANAGAAVKVLMLARGVQPHGIAAGIGPGLNWLYSDEARDGTTLVTGFGWAHPLFDPGDTGHVSRALRAFFPQADLVAHAWHDWNADPASNGTWLTAPAGRLDLVDPARFAPVGPLAFAGSDVAREEQGWFEGALRSGAAAATHVCGALAGQTA
jgi:monoamine oxidase